MKALYILITTLCMATATGLVAYIVMGNPSLEGLAAQVISSQTHSAFNSCIQSFTEQHAADLHIAQTAINTDHTTDAVIQFKKGPQCGNAGCVYELCVSNAAGSPVHVSLGIAGKSLTVLDTVTNGMHDLEFNQDPHQIMNWDAHEYVLSEH